MAWLAFSDETPTRPIWNQAKYYFYVALAAAVIVYAIHVQKKLYVFGAIPAIVLAGTAYWNARIMACVKRSNEECGTIATIHLVLSYVSVAYAIASAFLSAIQFSELKDSYKEMKEAKMRARR